MHSSGFHVHCTICHSPDTLPCISIEYLEVVWHLAHAPANCQLLHEQFTALHVCVAALFDAPPDSFAVNVLPRCMLAELLRYLADADVGVHMSLCADEKLIASLEAYTHSLSSAVDCDSVSTTFDERCAMQVFLTLSKLLRCDHIELFRWIGSALASPIAGLADKEHALSLLTECVKDENVRARLLARLSDTQIVAGLWAAVCSSVAYSTLQVTACTVLNAFKQRVTVDVLSSLQSQIAHNTSNRHCWSHALKAAIELCEWTDNVAVVEEFFVDHSTLVAACQSSSRSDDRVDACKLLQMLSYWPGNDVLDSLVRTPSASAERVDSLHCLAQLACNFDFRFVCYLKLYLHQNCSGGYLLTSDYISFHVPHPVHAWRTRVVRLSQHCFIRSRAAPAG